MLMMNTTRKLRGDLSRALTRERHLLGRLAAAKAREAKTRANMKAIRKEAATVRDRAYSAASAYTLRRAFDAIGRQVPGGAEWLSQIMMAYRLKDSESVKNLSPEIRAAIYREAEAYYAKLRGKEPFERVPL